MTVLVVSSSPERASTLYRIMPAAQRIGLPDGFRWVSLQGIERYSRDDVSAVLIDPDLLTSENEAVLRAIAVELVGRSTVVPLLRIA